MRKGIIAGERREAENVKKEGERTGTRGRFCYKGHVLGDEGVESPLRQLREQQPTGASPLQKLKKAGHVEPVF